MSSVQPLSPGMAAKSTYETPIAELTNVAAGPRCVSGVYLHPSVFRVNGDIESQARVLAVGEVMLDHGVTEKGGGSDFGSAEVHRLGGKPVIGKAIGVAYPSSALSDVLFGRSACLAAISLRVYRVQLVDDVEIDGRNRGEGAGMSGGQSTAQPRLTQHACRVCEREEKYGSEGGSSRSMLGEDSSQATGDPLRALYGNTVADHLLPLTVQRALAMAGAGGASVVVGGNEGSSSTSLSPSSGSTSVNVQQQQQSMQKSGLASAVVSPRRCSMHSTEIQSPASAVQLLTRSSSPLYRLLATRFRANRRCAVSPLHHFAVGEQILQETTMSVALGRGAVAGGGGEDIVSSIHPGMEIALCSMSVDEEAAFIMAPDVAYEQLVRMRKAMYSEGGRVATVNDEALLEKNLCPQGEQDLCGPLLFVVRVNSCSPAIRAWPFSPMVTKFTIVDPQICLPAKPPPPPPSEPQKPRPAQARACSSDPMNPLHYFKGCSLLFSLSQPLSITTENVTPPTELGPPAAIVSLAPLCRAQEAVALFIMVALGSSRYLQSRRLSSSSIISRAAYSTVPVLPWQTLKLTPGGHATQRVSGDPTVPAARAGSEWERDGDIHQGIRSPTRGSACTNGGEPYTSLLDEEEEMRMRLAHCNPPVTSTVGALRALSVGMHHSSATHTMLSTSSMCAEALPSATGCISTAIIEHNLAAALYSIEQLAISSQSQPQEGGMAVPPADLPPARWPSPHVQVSTDCNGNGTGWFRIDEAWRSLVVSPQADTSGSSGNNGGGSSTCSVHSALSFLEHRFFAYPREGATVSFRINLMCPLTGTYQPMEKVENVNVGTLTLPLWLEVALQSMKVREMATITVQDADDDVSFMSLSLTAATHAMRADLSAAAIASRASLDDFSVGLGRRSLACSSDEFATAARGWWPQAVSSAYDASVESATAWQSVGSEASTATNTRSTNAASHSSATTPQVNQTPTTTETSATTAKEKSSAFTLAFPYPAGMAQELLSKIEGEPGAATKSSRYGVHGALSQQRRNERTYRIVLDSVSNQYDHTVFYFYDPEAALSAAEALCSASDRLRSVQVAVASYHSGSCAYSSTTGSSSNSTTATGAAALFSKSASGKTRSAQVREEFAAGTERFFPPSMSSPRRGYMKAIQKLCFALLLLTFNVTDSSLTKALSSLVSTNGGDTATELQRERESRRYLLIGSILDKLSMCMTKVKGQSELVISTCSAALTYLPHAYFLLYRRADCRKENGDVSGAKEDLNSAQVIAQELLKLRLSSPEASNMKTPNQQHQLPSSAGSQGPENSTHEYNAPLLLLTGQLDADTIRSHLESIQAAREELERAEAEAK